MARTLLKPTEFNRDEFADFQYFFGGDPNSKELLKVVAEAISNGVTYNEAATMILASADGHSFLRQANQAFKMGQDYKASLTLHLENKKILNS